jgi:hypothetical protein
MIFVFHTSSSSSSSSINPEKREGFRTLQRGENETNFANLPGKHKRVMKRGLLYTHTKKRKPDPVRQ